MKSWILPEVARLKEQLTAKNLPHAMIFSGVSGAGKLELAQWLSQALICEQLGEQHTNLLETTSELPCGQCKNCHLYLQQTHPDHLTIEQVGQSIGVEQIRAVSRFFEKTAQLGKNQVVVIQAADKMTESAANALLKTLEEPTPNSYLILLVKDAQHLLPTIISRSRQLQLRPPVGEALVAQLGQHSEDNFVNLSHLAELSDPNVYQQYIRVMQGFIGYLYTGQQRMALLTLLEENEHSLRWLEKVCVDLFRGHYQWQQVQLPPEFNQAQFLLFVANKRNELYQVYQQINAYNKKVASYSQFNQTFGLEKLLADIQLTLNT